MGYYIPVFYIPVTQDEIPATLRHWYDAKDLLDQFGERANTTASRNWWHQLALSQICEGLGIIGLEFIRSEVACLGSDELRAAARAIDDVLERIKDGIPDLGPEIEAGAFEFTRRDFGEYEPGVYPAEIHRKAAALAKTPYDLEGFGDAGFLALVGFYSFIKTMRVVIADCLGKDKHLLYIQPQP